MDDKTEILIDAIEAFVLAVILVDEDDETADSEFAKKQKVEARDLLKRALEANR